MNKEKLISLMPTQVVNEDAVNKKIEEQRGIIKAGKSFVSQLSINRFMHMKKLAEFDIDEILSLFSDLTYSDFVIKENELYFNSELDIESFAVILEESFNLDNMYELDNVYIENLLNGKDITKEVVTLWEDKTMSFEDILGQFVFYTSVMSIADTPNVMRMLIAKKALLGAYLAEQNVKSLLNGQREIHDIAILM